MTQKKKQKINPAGNILFLLLLLLLEKIFSRPGKFSAGTAGHDEKGTSSSVEYPTPEVGDTESQGTTTPDPGNETGDRENPTPENPEGQIIVKKSIKSPPAILPAGDSAGENGETGK